VAVVSRAFWFAAGVASGVYGVFKVKRTVEILTPDGIGARVAAVRRGARVFADEVTVAARERESELLAELRATAAGDRLLSAAEPAAITEPRHRAGTTSANGHVDTRESITDGHR
jgi:hypothetical protein